MGTAVKPQPQPSKTSVRAIWSRIYLMLWKFWNHSSEIKFMLFLKRKVWYPGREMIFFFLPKISRRNLSLHSCVKSMLQSLCVPNLLFPFCAFQPASVMCSASSSDPLFWQYFWQCPPTSCCHRPVPPWYEHLLSNWNSRRVQAGQGCTPGLGHVQPHLLHSCLLLGEKSQAVSFHHPYLLPGLVLRDISKQCDAMVVALISTRCGSEAFLVRDASRSWHSMITSSPRCSVLCKALNNIQIGFLPFLLKGGKVIWLQMRWDGLAYISCMKCSKVRPCSTLTVGTS